MTIKELTQELSLEVISGKDLLERKVTGCYIGDLLSWVMGKAVPGDMWITIQNNLNVVAAAVMSEVACVVICEGVEVGGEVVNRADLQGVVVLGSPRTAYELAASYSRL